MHIYYFCLPNSFPRWLKSDIIFKSGGTKGSWGNRISGSHTRTRCRPCLPGQCAPPPHTPGSLDGRQEAAERAQTPKPNSLGPSPAGRRLSEREKFFNLSWARFMLLLKCAKFPAQCLHQTYLRNVSYCPLASQILIYLPASSPCPCGFQISHFTWKCPKPNSWSYPTT